MDQGRSGGGNYKSGGAGMYYSGPINSGGYQPRADKGPRGPMQIPGSNGNMDIPQASGKYMSDGPAGPMGGSGANPGMMSKKPNNNSDFPYQSQPKQDGMKKMGGPGMGSYNQSSNQQTRGTGGQSSNYYPGSSVPQHGPNSSYNTGGSQYPRDMMGKGGKSGPKDGYNNYSRNSNFNSGYMDQGSYYDESGKAGSKGGSDKGGRPDAHQDMAGSLGGEGIESGDQTRNAYRNKKYDSDASKQISGAVPNQQSGPLNNSYYTNNRRDNQRFDPNSANNKRDKFPNKKKNNKHRPDQFPEEYVESVADEQDSQGLGDSKILGSSTMISTHGPSSVHNMQQDKPRPPNPRDRTAGRDYAKKDEKITEQDARREEIQRKFADVPQFHHEVGSMVKS